MSHAFTVTSLVSLALLLPTTFALPFNLDFWNSKSTVPSYAGDDRPGHWHSSKPYYSTYTMTATSSKASFATASVHEAYAQSGILPTSVSGYTGATGTGTAVYPTGTSYAKRHLHHSGHAAASAASTGNPYELLWYDYPTAFPTNFPTAKAGKGVYVEQVKQHAGGPRKGNEAHYYPSFGSAPTLTATAVTAATTTAPCTETGYSYPAPTGTS